MHAVHPLPEFQWSHAGMLAEKPREIRLVAHAGCKSHVYDGHVGFLKEMFCPCQTGLGYLLAGTVSAFAADHPAEPVSGKACLLCILLQTLKRNIWVEYAPEEQVCLLVAAHN